MRLNHADARKWVINLRDGYLQMQRVFHFDTVSSAMSFSERIRGHEPLLGIEMSVYPDSLARDEVFVSLDFLPDRDRLASGGEIAAACEREYSLQLDLAHTAA